MLKGGRELGQEHTGSESPTGPDSAWTVLRQMDQGTKGITYGEGLTMKQSYTHCEIRLSRGESDKDRHLEQVVYIKNLQRPEEGSPFQ